MSEPIQQTIEPTEELATLRRVNAELVTKSATRKARVKELEAAVAELQGKLTAADTTIHDLTVAAPLNAMAESISVSSELFLEQFAKSYRLESIKGELTLQTADGKPVLKGDKPIPFERDALYALLTDDKHPQSKLFSTILIASRASGASIGTSRIARPVVSKPQAPQFGLR